MLKKRDENYLTIAKVGKKTGLRGCFNLISYTAPPENILRYKSLAISNNSASKTYEVEYIKHKNKNIFTCKLKEVSTPEDASKLTNQEIKIHRSQLPELTDDEYYWADLIGLRVINDNKEEIGFITNIFETGANDILEVKSKLSHHLIPYLDDVIINVDIDSQTMVVNWDISAID
jgi:16S rRNA processing protein RimM